MKSIVSFLNSLIPNQTVQSVLRYALTLFGAFLAGKGVSASITAFVAGGAILTLLAGLLGAANELYAPGGTWKQFWASAARKLVAFTGAFILAVGWVDSDTAERFCTLALTIIPIIWGTTDEAAAQAKSSENLKA